MRITSKRLYDRVRNYNEATDSGYELVVWNSPTVCRLLGSGGQSIGSVYSLREMDAFLDGLWEGRKPRGDK